MGAKTKYKDSVFIAKVREFEKECGDKTEAMKLAIIYCRENDILKEFLEKNGTEVINMLMTEWNWDDALAARYEEGMEEGRENERKEIARNALATGLSPEVNSEPPARSLFPVLCSLFSVLCSLFSVLCPLFSVLYSLFFVLCSSCRSW